MFSSKHSNNFFLHKNKILAVSLIILVMSILSACGSSQSTNTGTIGPVSFSIGVASIFNNRCIQCHSGAQASGGLDLSSYTGVMAGGGTGAVISPGNAGNSLLISLVQSGRMPKNGASLTPDQVTILTNWVNAGAQDN